MSDCTHGRTEVRRLITANGTFQLKRQCLDCWEGVSDALRMTDYPTWQEFPEFDTQRRDEARERAWERRRFQRQQARDEENTAWRLGHQEYLKSAEWRQKRLRVFVERRGICEGCRRDLLDGATGFPPPFEVHHVSALDAYRMRPEGFGGELLFQLVLLCPACHRRIPNKFSEQAAG